MPIKETNAGYDILHAVAVGRREVVLGENQAGGSRYVTWLRSTDRDGEMRYDWGNYFSEYRDALADLGRRVQEYAEMLPSHRKGTRKDLYQADDCMRNIIELKNTIIAVNPACMPPEYRLSDYQLILITGGEGCTTAAPNGIVHGIRLVDEEQMELRSSDIIGVVHPAQIPNWALNASQSIVDDMKSRTKKPERTPER